VTAAGIGVLRILIVEDERELGRLFEDYVSSLGHRAEVVGSAEAALERLQAARPHVIILDVKLPGMSGLEFLELPAVRDAAVPVIVVSGFVTEEQARQCLRAGALEFLAKPVPLDVLGTVLDHVAVLATTPDEGPSDRRLAARAAVTLPVRAVTEHGRAVTGAVLEVSSTGLRARFTGAVRTGSAVRLSITLLDGGAPLDVVALIVRADTDGSTAVWFLDMTPAEAERLLTRAQKRPH
jgi:two-component system nitrogen regulation response regulator NtrX